MTQEEKKLYEAANAYAWDIDTGDLNTNRDIFIAGAEWAYEHPTSDYAWKVYNFIMDYKSGKLGEVSLQDAIYKHFNNEDEI